jgi:uncharacterized membrane protein YeiH
LNWHKRQKQQQTKQGWSFKANGGGSLRNNLCTLQPFQAIDHRQCVSVARVSALSLELVTAEGFGWFGVRGTRDKVLFG